MSRLRRLAAGVALGVLVVGCGTMDVAGPATGKPSYTAAPATPTLDPVRKPVTVTHGAPYAADAIREALTASGSRVPAPLRSDPVAGAISEALAGRISSYDGKPYGELSLSGSCDDDGLRCDLQAKGVPLFAADRDAADLYTFSVEVATGVVAPAGEPALRGYPADLTPTLDEAVRAQRGDRLVGKSLLGIQWAPTPPSDGYVLRYGTGEEEADQQVIVRYDRTANTATVVGE